MKKTRLITVLILLSLLIGLLPLQACAAKTMVDTSALFTDIPKKIWYKQAVDYAYTWGMFAGTSKTTFEPETKVDRAMFVTVIARLDGAKVNNKADSGFTDVPKKQWYTGSVRWAAENGIVYGTSKTTFEPETAITREQLCAMLLRYAKFKNITLEKAVAKAKFVDDKAISSYAKSAVYACQQAGIVSGEKAAGGYVFLPAGNATRAQAAQILMVFHRNYIDVEDVPEIEDTPMEKNMTLQKTASLPLTVSPEGTLTYTLTVHNNNAKKVSFTLSDTLPQGTTYLSGDATVAGDALTFTDELAAGDTAVFSYTVKVAGNTETVVAPAATLGELKSDSITNYVGLTLDAINQAYLKQAVAAHSYSERLNPISLLRRIYYIAFSKTPTLRDTVELNLGYIFEEERTDKGDDLRKMVIPTLYGGENVIAANFVGESALPKAENLLVGDVVMSESEDGHHLYIFDGKELLCLDDNCVAADTAAVLTGLSTAKKYAVLRPSLHMPAGFVFYENNRPDQLSQVEQALLATADAYIQRGLRVQYDDTRMPDAYPSSTDRGEFRWQIGQYQPEDYTTDKWGYLNCAGFTYDIYRTALGHDLGKLYTTEQLASHYVNGGAVGVPMYPYYYKPDSAAIPAQRAAVEEGFFNTLKIGDLVVIRRNNGNGHVMMYVGNNTVVHSTGSSYTYSSDSETYEPTIRYMDLRWYLFDENADNYVFGEDGYIQHLCIVRPLDTYNGTIPENTQNRMANLKNIYSEKVASLGQGGSVSVGGEVTFTFRIRNLNNVVKTLTVTDSVPAGATLQSAGGATVDGTALTWQVTLNAGETKEVSYTVTATGNEGDYIYSAVGKVGGVLHTCPRILIKNTLSASQQAALRAAALELQANNPKNLTGLAAVNEIYTKAGLTAPFVSGSGTLDISALRSSLFSSVTNAGNSSNKAWSLNTASPYCKLVAPTLYGGRRFFTPNQYTATTKVNTDRNRLAREQDLVVGDILVVKFQSSEPLYMYIGDGIFINLSSLANDTYSADIRLARMPSAYHYYAVLRPSFGF